MVGEFDITKADPDEQVMKVNRIITHPKVNILLHQQNLTLCPFGVDSIAGIERSNKMCHVRFYHIVWRKKSFFFFNCRMLFFLNIPI